MILIRRKALARQRVLRDFVQYNELGPG
jgi:hypothetical protein